MLHNRTRGTLVAREVLQPRGAREWALGLLVRPPLQPGQALWLNPCGGVHTWGMRYAIDVLFLDPELTVLRVVRDVRPWRLVFAPRRTRSVLELPAGGAASVQAGDRLSRDGTPR